MFEFQVATEQAVKESENDGEVVEELFEFTIGKQTFAARRPTPGETNILFSSRGDVEGTVATWRFLRSVLKGTGFRRMQALVEDGTVPPSLLFGGDDLNESGIVDTIVREFAGRPPGSSGDSSESPPPAGQRSTGRAPGRGSTSSSSD
jgi:hypothetical protein